MGEGGRRPDEVLPSAVPSVLFEDASLLVLNKPAGLVVHPAKGHRGVTLIDWLRDQLGARIVNRFVDSERLGLVHRLDKDTSGVLLVAKSVEAQTALSRQFRDRTIRKTYGAFVEGILSAPTGVISAPVARSRKNPARMAVCNYGRPSETTFQVNEGYQEVTQVTLFPKTGRTHQIRVHMSAVGHPILGDMTYGSKTIWAERYGIKRSLLHAEKLEFLHPVTEEAVSFEAPWPEDFKAARQLFRKGLSVFLFAVSLGAAASRAGAESAATASPAAAKKTAHHSSGASSSAGSATAAALKSLKKETAALTGQMDQVDQQVDALKEQLANLQSGFEQLGIASRLQDLEHAVSELNAKAVGSATAVEETKTQALETGRKMKALSDALDQMRDQMDRMQQELILRRTKQDAAPAPEPAAEAAPAK